VLFGHSGGAATLSFYQAVAEEGTGYCNTPQRITVCGAELSTLPKADALVLVDASLGNPIGLLRGLNAAVTVEGDPSSIDPALDPFSAANGFRSDGAPGYTPEFKRRYATAQSARMNRLIEAAAGQVRQFATARAPFPDDNVFLVVRAQGARLVDAETFAASATAQPRKHLRNDGKVVTEVVRPVRPFTPAVPAQNAQFEGGARLLTLRSFLSANAIRSTDSRDGIEWCSTNNSTPCAVGHIRVPLLVAAMGGNTGLRDNELLFEMSASRDKDFVVVEGATHNMEPCRECETKPGQYGNSTKNFFNYVTRWIDARF
jgi:hypothetical protein